MSGGISRRVEIPSGTIRPPSVVRSLSGISRRVETNKTRRGEAEVGLRAGQVESQEGLKHRNSVRCNAYLMGM